MVRRSSVHCRDTERRSEASVSVSPSRSIICWHIHITKCVNLIKTSFVPGISYPPHAFGRGDFGIHEDRAKRYTLVVICGKNTGKKNETEEHLVQIEFELRLNLFYYVRPERRSTVPEHWFHSPPRIGSLTFRIILHFLNCPFGRLWNEVWRPTAKTQEAKVEVEDDDDDRKISIIRRTKKSLCYIFIWFFCRNDVQEKLRVNRNISTIWRTTDIFSFVTFSTCLSLSLTGRLIWTDAAQFNFISFFFCLRSSLHDQASDFWIQKETAKKCAAHFSFCWLFDGRLYGRTYFIYGFRRLYRHISEHNAASKHSEW